MTTELALRLASKHNRAAGFTHDMTTWDKVSTNVFQGKILSFFFKFAFRSINVESYCLNCQVLVLMKKHQQKSQPTGRRLVPRS